MGFKHISKSQPRDQPTITAGELYQLIIFHFGEQRKRNPYLTWRNLIKLLHGAEELMSAIPA